MLRVSGSTKESFLASHMETGMTVSTLQQWPLTCCTSMMCTWGDPAHTRLICRRYCNSAVYFSLGHIAMTFLEEIPKIPLFPRVLSIWQKKSPCRLALPVLEISLWVGVFFLKIWRTAAAKVSIAFILCSWYWYSHYYHCCSSHDKKKRNNVQVPACMIIA